MNDDHRTIHWKTVPLNSLLPIPMFLRFYLIGRFMALNSVQFKDAATRSIARLNRVTVNFAFVMRSLMSEHPLRVLFSFTVMFWIAMSWILVQCERYRFSYGKYSTYSLFLSCDIRVANKTELDDNLIIMENTVVICKIVIFQSKEC